MMLRPKFWTRQPVLGPKIPAIVNLSKHSHVTHHLLALDIGNAKKKFGSF